MSVGRSQGYTGRGITCWSGNDDEAHEARHSSGAAGVISVTSNLIPGLFSSLMQTQDDALMERWELWKGLGHIVMQQRHGMSEGDLECHSSF